MFELAGSTGRRPREAAARDGVRAGKALAEASLDNVALRDPKQTDHKTTFAELAETRARLRLGRYFDAAGLPRGDLNVNEPKFLKEFDRQLAGDAARRRGRPT